MDTNPLFNPNNPFVIWVYTLTYLLVFGYLAYLIWRARQKD